MASRYRAFTRVARKYATPFGMIHLFAPPRMSADSRGAVYPDLGLFYNRIPKAANTTVVALLNEIRTGRMESVDGIKKSITHPSKLNWREAVGFRTLYKFTFVRNPYDRLLSAWLQKIAGGIESYSKIPGFDRGDAQGFADFVSYLQAEGPTHNKHWRPQYRLFVLPPRYFDYIGRVESFKTDMETILQQHGLAMPAGRSLDTLYPTDKAGKQTGATARRREFYGTKEIETVRKLYSRDFKLFGYSEDPDWL